MAVHGQYQKENKRSSEKEIFSEILGKRLNLAQFM